MQQRYVILGMVATLALTAISASFADTALVVGINKYPGLRDGAQSYDLNGCVNDAQTVADSLKNSGFDNVIFLADEQATKENILGKLHGLPLKKEDRFTFYFAGHGTTGSSGDSSLLTYQSSANSEANDIGAQELYQAISALHCRARSVMMDSCFSGGMMKTARGLPGHGHRASRGYVRKTLALVPVKANQSDGVQKLTGRAFARAATEDICYLAAARANEQALEDTFGTQVHGLFTKYLVDTLTKGDTQCWGDLHVAIGQQVEENSDQLQHPVLSPGFTDKPLFGGARSVPIEVPQPQPKSDPAPQPTPKPAPAVIPTDKKWDVYHGQNVDPAQIKLELDPNLTTLIENKDRFALKATVGKSAGYLVILERGTSGNIKVLYPMDMTTATAKVAINQVVSFPGQDMPDKKLACDSPGHEFVKAILFLTEDGANALLDIFRKSAGPQGPQISGGELTNSKDIFVVDSHTKETSVGFYTSDVTFEVVKP